MKRQMSGWLLAGFLAGFVSSAVAQSATAYSSSAIGVIKKTIPAGKLILLSVPLDQESDTGDGFVFSSVPAFSNMPDGSYVNFWDATNQKWVLQDKTTKGGWGDQQNRRIVAGECFFLKNSGSTNIELVISGEVPPDDTISRGIPGQALQTVANPYPVEMILTNFSFANGLPDGSYVNFWDVDTQRWVMQDKTTKGGWGNEQSRKIAPGEGFFVKSANASSTTWTEERPYSWPK